MKNFTISTLSAHECTQDRMFTSASAGMLNMKKFTTFTLSVYKNAQDGRA